MEASGHDQLAASGHDQLAERSSVVVGGVVCRPQPLTRGEVTVHATNGLQLVEDKLRENEKYLFKTSPLKNYFFVDLYRQPDISTSADRGTAFLTSLERVQEEKTYATFLTAGHVLFSFDRIVLKHSSHLLKGVKALESVETIVDLRKPHNYKKGWFEVCPKFTMANPTEHTAHPHDYGAIFVEKTHLEQVMEQNGISLDGARLTFPQSVLTQPQDVFVAGYPEKVYDTVRTNLASSEGTYLPRSCLPNHVIAKRVSGAPVPLPAVGVHTADTLPGSSGSPVVVGKFSDILSQPEWTVIAIHVSGEDLSSDNKYFVWSSDAPENLRDCLGVNFAVPITQEMLGEILRLPGKPSAEVYETDSRHQVAEGDNVPCSDNESWKSIGKLAKYIVGEWESLADELGVPPWKQKEVEINHPRNVRGAARAMLHSWYKSVPRERKTATVQELSLALARCGLQDTCEEWLAEIGEIGYG